MKKSCGLGASVRVVGNEDGRPVAGACVVVQGPYGRRGLSRARTDDQGRAELRNLPLGGEEGLVVVVTAGGRAAASTELRCELGADRYADVTLRLARARRLRGRVLRPDGTPARLALVRAAPVDPCLPAELDDPVARVHPGPSAVTGLRGRFVLCVPEGEESAVQAYLRTFGFTPSVRVAAADEDVELRLPEPARVTVTVVDERSRPVVGAAVTYGGWLDLRTRRTRADGSLAFRSEVGCPVPSVEVERRGYVPAMRFFTPRSGRALRVRVVLARPVRVSGRVVDDRGLPVRNARVEASPAGTSPVVECAVTGPDGRFVLDGLPTGACDVVVRARGHAEAETKRVRAPSTGVELVVARAATVVLRLRPPGDAPLPDVIEVGRWSLEPYGPDSSTRRRWRHRETLWRAAVPRDGMVRVDGMRPGRQDVRVVAGGLLGSVEVRVRPGETVTGVDVPLCPAPPSPESV